MAVGYVGGTHTKEASRVRDEYDQCLGETEAAHLKITESTKTLLAVALRERDVLQKSAGFK